MGHEIGRLRAMLVAVGGVAAALGLYWDDAWHTDVGRDAFLAPPHLLLYAGVTVLLGTAGTWAWSRCREVGWVALRDPVVALPLVGAGVTLASAPVDDLWHELFGRDAVVWSPPHMVAVAGMMAFAAGLSLAVHRDGRTSRLAGAVTGAFLIAAVGTVVMEFEADVPQFPVVAYLPVNVAALTFAFALVRRASGRAWAATWAATTYVLLRVAAVAFLAALAHSLPTVMPTAVAAWVFDLGVQRRWRRSVLAVASASATVASHALAHGLQPAGLTFSPTEVAVGAALGSVAAWVAIGAVGVGVPPTRSARAVRLRAAGLLTLVLLAVGVPASAHDPGQGEEVAAVVLTSVRDGHRVDLEVTGDSCDGWRPRRVVARRAGQVRAAPLRAVGGCVAEGTIDLDDPGRWFLYAEIDVHGTRTEAWLPVEDGRQAKDTALYAAPPTGTPLGQVLAGTALYVLVVAILGAVALAVRRATPQEETASTGASTPPRKVYR